MEGAPDNYKVYPETNPSAKSNKKHTILYKLRTHFKSYCNHTSIHGFQYFGQNRTIFEKCWWIFIFICIISGCGYGIYLIYNKWQQSPVIVSLTTRDTPIYQVPFPAVTICPTIRFFKKCMNYGVLFKNVTEGNLNKHNISSWTKNEKNLLHYMIPLCKRNDALHELIDEPTSSDEIYEAIRNCSPFVSGEGVTVHFMNEILTFNSSFNQLFTEDGLCFSFNMLSTENIFKNTTNFKRGSSSSSGPKSFWIPQQGYSIDADLDTFPRRALLSGAANSLEIKLRHRKEDIDYVCTGAEQGYKVILHLPTRVPRPTLEYNMAPFGKSTTIRVDPHMMSTSTVVKSYDPKKRDCYFSEEKYLQYFNIYSKTNCDFECITNYTLKECGCVPFHMPREISTPLCGIGMRGCVIFAAEKYNLMKLKSKLKESKRADSSTRMFSTFTEVAFDNNTDANETENVGSRKKRQVEPLLEDADEDEARCSCMRSCSDITYKGSASTTDYNWRESSVEEYSNVSSEYDYSLITIYLDTNVLFTTERNELYGPTDFLSNFGGLLGLFTGFSILSFMEIIYFCSLRIVGNQRIVGRWYGDKEE
ncbi:pickpocket protein 28-like [Coccinella septempunctata]|uniref:pickpocket protein 28-like n=1 Tax=Coccinella septempunctata TaxID=41139 RepID=UPI001D06A415|nr:pickpocket protein 28-like [Coccinella septempunctata]XP_044759457.1 pickpocket protein 28-like [Coccinella septempunctata]XP_044759458.1 pickpocket protein 28-like [Coccinella septempunctata]XP_044759459.1 pickpocket protein 28-like [Coccinella septempunctata]